jgi:uncharacterized protein (DUF1697 family)
MSAKTYLALLRGINVGGKDIIKMDALKQAFEEISCTGVKTYIQSGNVIFRSLETGKAKLKQSLETALSEKFNFDARLLLLDRASYKKIIEEIPAGFGDEPETYRYDVWFLMNGLSAGEVISNVSIREGVDWIYGGKNAVYAKRLISQAGKSRLTKIIGHPVYQNMTIRNWNTCKKLLARLLGYQ